MKFALEAISKNSGRLGCISKSDKCSVKTPLLLQYTRAGSLPHLSREVYDCLENDQKALEFAVETCVHMNDSLTTFQKGLAAFAGLDDHISFATLRDTGTTYKWFHSQVDVSIITKSGKIALSPQKYMDAMESMRPDIFHTLCDGDTSENCTKKRVQNAVNRTKTFFDGCIERYKTSEVLGNSLLIAPIEGGYITAAREECIKELQVHEDQIGGYFLDGFHNGAETATNVNDAKVKEVVGKCTSLLKEDKLRCILGAYSPLLTLELVQLGIDVFDTSYAYLATQNNRALVFSFDVTGQKALTAGELSIDLTDTKFKDDFEPYSAECRCLACQKHTKAYTHHLLNTKELLGPILLMIHNTHHYMEFFKAIRAAIATDTLPNIIELVATQSLSANVPLSIEIKRDV